MGEHDEQAKAYDEQQRAEVARGGTAEGEDQPLREEDVTRGDALDDRVSEEELPGDGAA